MHTGRIASLMAAALVAGVVAGNAVSGFAAGTTTSTTTGAALRMGPAIRDAGGRLADVVASLTGQSVDDIRTQRVEGTSFADIAAAKDVSVDAVVDKALDVRKDVLDAKVKDGSLTQDQADAALDRMEDRVTDRAQSTDGSCGSGTCDGTGAGSGGKGNSGGGKGNGNGGGARDGSCLTQ